jgi:glycosyltransferase 2 family protein
VNPAVPAAASGTATVPDAAVPKVFASGRDERRVRRPADRLLLIASLVAFALAAWTSHAGHSVTLWIDSVFDGAPEFVVALASVAFSAAGVWLIVVVLAIVLSRRRALLRDVALAWLATGALAVLCGWLMFRELPVVIPELSGSTTPRFPVVRLALAVAALHVTRPSFAVPVRSVNRWVVAALAVATMVLDYGSVSAVAGGIALGFAGSALVRTMLGTSEGVPTLSRVRAALDDLGVPVVELEFADDEEQGRVRVHATHADGRRLDVDVYGRDAADWALANRFWRSMWYRDAKSLLGVSRQQLAERTALALLLAARDGLEVPRVVAVGIAGSGDVALVTTAVALDGHLAAVGEADDPSPHDAAVLDAMWAFLHRLHAAGLAHGQLRPSIIRVDVDGSREAARAVVAVTDLSDAVVSPPAEDIERDVVTLLALSAATFGTREAVSSAVRSSPSELLARSLPHLQPAALPREVTLQVKAADIDVDELRGAVAAEIGVDEPKLVRLRRVRVADVVMLVLLLVVANAILSWLGSIDLTTFVDELANASIGWLVVALLISQATVIADTVALSGIVSQHVPFGPTIHFQYATSYIGLAVPSDAGRIAMTIRYLQKLGVPTNVAVGQGPFTTVIGWGFDAILLVVTARVVGTSLELPDDADLSVVVTVFMVIVAAAIVGAVVVLVVPALRDRVVPAVVGALREMRQSLTDPNRAARVIGGVFARKILFAMTLGAIVAAYGSPQSFATVVFVNTAVSWFAGIMPVPGGIGVAEAGFTLGLVAFGVPEPVALAAAITHRLITTYLPPVVGYFSMQRLERDGYL